MLTTFALTLLGFLLFIAPHHARGDIFRRRRFYQHIGEIFSVIPPRFGAVVLMALAACIFLSPFYPAAAVLLLFSAPPEDHLPILIIATVACALAALTAPVIMIFIFTPIGFGGSSKESTPRTPFFYIIPAYLALAAVWFLLAAFIPSLRALP